MAASVEVLVSVLWREAGTVGGRRGRFVEPDSAGLSAYSPIERRRFASSGRPTDRLVTDQLIPETNSSNPARPRDSSSVGDVPQSSNDSELVGETGDRVRNRVRLLGGDCRRV